VGVIGARIGEPVGALYGVPGADMQISEPLSLFILLQPALITYVHKLRITHEQLVQYLPDSMLLTVEL